MVMLTIQTFLLMLVSAVLGDALGRMLGQAFGPVPETARPWLREAGGKPAAPSLPPTPALLSAEERARLAAAASSSAPAAEVGASAAKPAAPPAPAATPVALEPGRTPAPSENDLTRAAAADRHGQRPVGVFERHDAPVDDLEIIRGIGPTNRARLNALGIWSFAQIAAWTPENAEWVGSYLAFQGRIEREDWIGQAKELLSARSG